MLEITEDKIKIWYQFNSRRCAVKYDCENWDFNEFYYEISVDDAKDIISYKVAKNTENETHSISILEALNELDDWECISWEKIIHKCEDILKDHYEMEAMDWYANQKMQTY